MSLLTRIPEALLTSVLSKWLTIADVAHLDSAVCNKALRCDFFNTAYRSGITKLQYPSTIESSPRTVCDAMNAWIFAKGAMVDALFVTPVLVHCHQRRREYLEMYGYAVRWVSHAHWSNPRREYTLHCRFSEDIAQYCANLELYHGGWGVTDTILVKLFQRCPLLKEVKGLGDDCTREVIMVLSRYCHNLRRVELGRWHLDESCLIALVRSNPDLVVLDVYCMNATGKFVRELANHCSRLVELEIHMAELPLSSLCVLMKSCLGMKSLQFHACGLTAGEVEHGVYDNMRVLIFNQVDITDDELGNLLQACPNLTELEVLSCRRQERNVTLPIGARCPNLQKFTSYGTVHDACDELLIELGRNCPHLKYIDLPNRSHVTTEGMSSLARHCPLLDYVNIWGCEQVGDGFLTVLARHCPGLRMLYVSECPLITYQGLQVVMAGCTALEELDVDCDGEITEDEALEIMARYPKTRRSGVFD
jgi:hypothetical protein